MPSKLWLWLGGVLALTAVSKAQGIPTSSAIQEYVAGQRAAAAGDYPTALRHFLAAEEGGYDNPLLNYELGRVYERLKRYEEARERFDRFAQRLRKLPGPLPLPLSQGGKPPEKRSLGPPAKRLPPAQLPAGWDFAQAMLGRAGLREDVPSFLSLSDGAEGSAGREVPRGLQEGGLSPVPSSPPILTEAASLAGGVKLPPVRPNTPTYHPRYRMALIYLKRRQYAEAVEALRQYLAEAPEASNRGEVEQTLQSLEQALQKGKSVPLTTLQQSAGRPGGSSVSPPPLDRATARALARQLRTAVKKAEAKDFPAALSAFQRAFSLAPNASVEVKSRSWLAYLALGQALQEVGRLEEALSALQRAVQLAPQEPMAHFQVALVQQAMGRFEAAAAAYREVIRLQPERPEPHNNLALVLKKQGRGEEALAEYRTAVQLNPEDAVSRSNLAAALFEGERWEEAATEYRALLERQPQDPLSRCMLGRALAAQGKLAEALAEFQEAVRRSPQQALPHNTLAWFHLAAPYEPYRDLASGLQEARQAVELAPQNPYCLGTLGLAYYRNGDYPTSLQWTHRGLDASRELAARALNLYLGSMAQAQLGHWEPALKLYRAAVAADPRNELRAEAQTLLEQGLGSPPATSSR